MDNPEATLGTQDTGRAHLNNKKMSNTYSSIKPGVNPGGPEGKVVPATHSQVRQKSVIEERKSIRKKEKIHSHLIVMTTV